MKRYELSDSQWRKVEGFLPGRPGSVGVTAKDNRNFVTGVCGYCVVARTGNTCLPSMETGRVPTSVSLAGPSLDYGSDSST